MNDWPELRQAASEGQPASFRGVPFHVLMAEDDLSHSVAVHEFPHRSGAEVEDLGRKAHRHNSRCVFFRDTYTDLSRFLDAIQKTGPGELLHPVLGGIEAVVGGARLVHQAPKIRYAEVRVEFIAHEPDGRQVKLLGGISSSGIADRARDGVETALSAGRERVTEAAEEAQLGGLSDRERARLAMQEAAEGVERHTGTEMELPAGAGGWTDAPDEFCDQTEVAMQSRVRTVLATTGSVGSNLRLFTIEVEALNTDIESRSAGLAREARRFVRLAGAAATVYAAAELLEAGLSLEDGNPYQGEYLNMEAEPVEEAAWV